MKRRNPDLRWRRRIVLGFLEVDQDRRDSEEMTPYDESGNGCERAWRICVVC